MGPDTTPGSHHGARTLRAPVYAVLNSASSTELLLLLTSAGGTAAVAAGGVTAVDDVADGAVGACALFRSTLSAATGAIAANVALHHAPTAAGHDSDGCEQACVNDALESVDHQARS